MVGWSGLNIGMYRMVATHSLFGKELSWVYAASDVTRM